MILIDLELPDDRKPNLAELILTSIPCHRDVKAEAIVITETDRLSKGSFELTLKKGLTKKSMYSRMVRRNI